MFENNPNMKKTIIILFFILLAATALYFVKSNSPKLSPVIIVDDQTASTTILSADKKSIVVDGKVALSIDDELIFKFFKNESQLCDSSNINSNPGRKMFCEDKVTFKNLTRFKSIVVSGDGKKVGLTIESDTLSPDTVVGIFYPNKTLDKVSMLSNYYLGNEFIIFSPNSINFVYRGGCWEAMCAFYIKDSKTLEDKINFIPQEPDSHGNYEFVKWISDTEIEYKLDSILKKGQLQTSQKVIQKIEVGHISGHITIGPFCPVEREGVPCKIPSEAYTTRSIIVYEADGVTIKEKVKIDIDGIYLATLNPGVYFLQVQPAGIGPGEKKKVIVTSNKTSVINFDIDTGIR